MSLVVSVNGIYHSYFEPENAGVTSSNKKQNDSNLKKNALAKKAESLYVDNSKKDKVKRFNLYAYELMSHPVTSISPTKKASEAIELMQKAKVHHLIVIENKAIVGIISDRDLLKSTGRTDKFIKDIMTEKVILCRKETEMRLIAKIMLDEDISSLPVIDDEHVLLGIVTKTDLVKCIVNNMPLDTWG